MVLVGRIGQIARHQDAADETGQAHLVEHDGEERAVHGVEGKGGQHDVHNELGRPLPDTGVGLPVKLAHQRIGVVEGLGTGGQLFLEHRNSSNR